MSAYFWENRDISFAPVLRALWDELTLPAESFAAAIVGAHPEALHRRWIDRSLERGQGLGPSLLVETRKEQA